MDGMICPRCMERTTCRVDVTDGNSITCDSCAEGFTAQDLAELVESWAKVLPWLAAHPARQQAGTVQVTARAG
jgi:hypothetical protein